MGRLGPLTSQALGRSPYDSVVQGEGEDDPRAPPQLYDARGRPINPETKRINKDVVRSHNEVMLVIGVAEPENGVAVDAQMEERMRRNENDENIGRRLRQAGCILEIGGLWGVNGLRQRILLYQQYSQIPFYQLYRHERTQNSLSSLFFAGFPSFVLCQVFKRYAPVPSNIWLSSALHYAKVHVQVFIFMQRVGLISAYPWFPDPRYFVPFSSLSPIPAPPPIADFSAQSVLRWLGTAALNAVPLVAFFGLTKLWVVLSRTVWWCIYPSLPSPAARKSCPIHPSLSTAVTAGSESPEHEHGLGQGARPEVTTHILESQGPSDQTALEATRRHSTFSGRGDEYVSDEEETEMANPTLISFDVEANETSDTPPGVWSAELRPSVGDGRPSSREEPVFADNALTRMPSVIAADTLAVSLSQVLVAPIEAFALRLLTRAFLHRRGLPLDNIYSLNVFGSVSRTGVVNFLMLQMVHLLIEFEVWGFMTLVAELHRDCEADWSFYQVLREKFRALRGTIKLWWRSGDEN